jgi:hypothetical protein
MILEITAAATWFLTGLIWFVQVVHYPLFPSVGRQGFPSYERLHAMRTTWVVAPVMLLELVGAVWIVAAPPSGMTSPAAWAGLALLAIIWYSTAFVQVPCHRILGDQWDEAVGHRLVRSNWIRTAAWSGRAILAIVLLREGGAGL